MRKFLSLSLLVAALSTSVPAFAQDYGYRTVFGMDALHLKLVGRTVTERVLDGSIEPEVRRVHTDRLSTPPQFFLAAYNANMYVLEQKHCANARQVLGLESASCIHFSQTNY